MLVVVGATQGGYGGSPGHIELVIQTSVVRGLWPSQDEGLQVQSDKNALSWDVGMPSYCLTTLLDYSPLSSVTGHAYNEWSMDATYCAGQCWSHIWRGWESLRSLSTGHSYTCGLLTRVVGG